MTAQFKIQNSKFKIAIQKLKFLKTFEFLLVFLTFNFYLLTFTSPAFAQTASPSSTLSTFQESGPTWKVPTVPLPTTVSPASPLYTDLLVSNLFHSFSCLAIGQSIIGQPCLTYQFTKNAQGALQGVPVLSQTNLSGGALGATTSVIGMLYQNPPVRTADYLASVGKGLGIVKTAHAQVVGSGEQVLHPILSLWQVSRNISYVIMIIIFVVIGVMVMFRNKLNPQTVITAQAALPGLVIGLILITFSYFLAGLISDMAFVGTNVVGYYFTAAQGKLNDPTWADQLNLADTMKDKNILGIFSPFTGVVESNKIADALAAVWHSLENPNRSDNPFDSNFLDPSRAITALAAMLVLQLLMPFGNMAGGLGQIAVAIAGGGYTLVDPRGTVSLALGFVAVLILTYSMFKLLLRLVNNYLTIILLTFTAPFQFLAAALPGRQGIATSWILNMLANILVFPAVLAVFYFVVFLLGPTIVNQRCTQPACPFKISQLNSVKQNSFISVANAEEPPNRIVDKSAFPLFGGFDLSFLRLILAFGALVALPSIPDIIGRTIGRLGATGQLIGQEIGGSMGQGQRYAGQFQQGVGGFANQVGRITDQPGQQYIPDGKGGFTVIDTKSPGQWSKFTKGISQARTSIKNRFGGGGVVT